ncbi:MAG TPA: hypothetical protein VGM06_08905 [Polyangiaceae bacterium]|jgi:hypothetical protein
MRQMGALFLPLFVASLPALTSCSTKTDTPAPPEVCTAFVSDAGLSTAVSFVSDVAPILQQNCASGGFNCHGTDQNRPYLGDPDGGIDPAATLASIVSVLSPEDPLMVFVAPHDPSNSYLMHKMDGDQCTLAAACAMSRFAFLDNCGNDMPNGGPTLPLATRDLVRAWIAQGALDN